MHVQKSVVSLQEAPPYSPESLQFTKQFNDVQSQLMLPESSNQYLAWGPFGKHGGTLTSDSTRHDWLLVERSALRMDKVWHESEFKYMTF